MKIEIPHIVRDIASELHTHGFKAYAVGGCVRDLLLGRNPKDWDVATDAIPKEIQKIFPESVYENEFGTVGIKSDTDDPTLKIVEVTTFRLEGKYTDKRHPDEVTFAKTIEEDLSRRDFTVNALALNISNEATGDIIDPFEGENDLKTKTIRTVGKPEERFEEDALRLMRAVRFATELNGFSAGGGPSSGWEIEFNTRRAIEKLAGLLEAIAKERVRDELVKILLSHDAAKGIILLEELDLLRYVMPELREGLGVSQNLHHIYTVFEHNVRSLDYATKQNYSLPVRMAALLHDVGKPKTKGGDGKYATFYGHEVVGARMTLKILERLKFSKEFTEEVAHLVRYHMFYYNVGEVSPAGVRRFLVRVGPEYVDDLIKLREADRIGSGVKKAIPYKLRHFLFMIEKVKRDPVSPKMLVVRGEDVMGALGVQPGPRIGQVLTILLNEVIEDPKRNDREFLLNRVKELGALEDKELRDLSIQAKKSAEDFEFGVEVEMKKKHFVQ